MKKIVLLLLFPLQIVAQSEQKQVMAVVQQFFNALEKQDSLAISKIILAGSYTHVGSQNGDTIKTGGRPASDFKFDRNRIFKERFREPEVTVLTHKNIAMVWGFYDFWINDKFSHCGVDVFTLLNTSDGWKISAISYTVEKEGCK